MSLDRRPRIPLTELPSFQEGLQRRIFEINGKFEDYVNQQKYTPDYFESYLEKS